MAALNILSKNEFQKRVTEISDLLSSKLKKLQKSHSDKIQEIKGNGILNGIIFKSYPAQLAEMVEKIPASFIKDKSFFLKKITATAISSELYSKHNILTAINDSSFSNHLCISPSLVIEDKDISYFFDCLDDILKENLNIKSAQVILNYIKSLF